MKSLNTFAGVAPWVPNHVGSLTVDATHRFLL